METILSLAFDKHGTIERTELFAIYLAPSVLNGINFVRSKLSCHASLCSTSRKIFETINLIDRDIYLEKVVDFIQHY